jgi:hypothetical protein
MNKIFCIFLLLTPFQSFAKITNLDIQSSIFYRQITSTTDGFFGRENTFNNTYSEVEFTSNGFYQMTREQTKCKDSAICILPNITFQVKYNSNHSFYIPRLSVNFEKSYDNGNTAYIKLGRTTKLSNTLMAFAEDNPIISGMTVLPQSIYNKKFLKDTFDQTDGIFIAYTRPIFNHNHTIAGTMMIGNLVINNDKSLMSIFSRQSRAYKLSSSALAQLYTIEYKYVEAISINIEHSMNNLTAISNTDYSKVRLDLNWLRYGITYQNEDFLISGETYRIRASNVFERFDHPAGYYGLIKYYVNSDTTVYIGYVDSSTFSNDIRGKKTSILFNFDRFSTYSKDLFVGTSYTFNNNIKLVVDFHNVEGKQFLSHTRTIKLDKYWQSVGFAVSYSF